MDTAKVEVAFARDVGNVDWDTEVVAEGVYLRGGSWIVDRGKDKSVGWCCFRSDILCSGERPGDVCDLGCVSGEAVLDLGVEWVWGD